MSGETAVSLSYDLKVPSGTQAPQGLAPQTSHSFPLADTSEKVDLKTYYAALRNSLAAARDKAGEDLTRWRDAVGPAEASKEGGKRVKEDEDEDEEAGEGMDET
ncbi:hypothetical protein CONPUDRAFT_161862 [Coniophora puteana RWD-64-598 SS2]|uniref:EKC/KEOPS complex subunit GON7 n=1 Tax=Coniophora puteana (strain RWD-64-598) TaxID=741705 RepID=A0A5M3N7M5_CONPW|nr:uncharacterized protein CONPUDRAFT_161862 [Coniophora puteana RWD-64-598 SS2]EIW87288.1 hypothetical protein CONPUDRAFT_161862 [Coniophora puteana RWD-64-598 SS2]